VLGSGASGVVFEAQYFSSAESARQRGNGAPVAAKQITLDVVPEEQELIGRGEHACHQLADR
jgi:hypothetical protein